MRYAMQAFMQRKFEVFSKHLFLLMFRCFYLQRKVALNTFNSLQVINALPFWALARTERPGFAMGVWGELLGWAKPTTAAFS